MFSYMAYGLGIRSALPIPELVAREAPADITIHWGKVSGGSCSSGAGAGWLQLRPDGLYCFVDQLGAFLVREGREIVLDPVSGAAGDELRCFVLGLLLAILLHQRGLLALHASAVAVGGRGAIFLGFSKRGKSTLAAAFHAQGHAILADDLTAVQAVTGRPVVLPGFPRLRLWPDAARVVAVQAEMSPQCSRPAEKQSVSTLQGFPLAPVPLGRIYLLAEGSRVKVESMSPREAFGQLLLHTYASGLLPDLGAEHFRQCVQLSRGVPVLRLRRRWSLAALSEVIRRVEQDLSESVFPFGEECRVEPKET